MNPDDVQPGDVILVQIRDGSWLTKLSAWAIRVGAVLTGQPSDWNHVIVAHHHDEHGVYYGAQGQPGQVAWVPLEPWLADAVTLTNADQPKTVEQRQLICDAVLPLVEVARYDWTAIAADTGIAFDAARHVSPLWGMIDHWGPGVPGHVICSSLADYAYERAGLASPAADRFCTPADWSQFIERRQWEK